MFGQWTFYQVSMPTQACVMHYEADLGTTYF